MNKFDEKQATINSIAVFNEDRNGNKYRYVLERTWDNSKDKPMASVIMFNPSYADELRYDYTSMKIINYLIDKGECRGVYILNLYPIIKATREEVKGSIKELGKIENNRYITEKINNSSKVYLAWGSKDANVTRIKEVINILKNKFKYGYVLVDKNQNAKHPSRCTIDSEIKKVLEELYKEI